MRGVYCSADGAFFAAPSREQAPTSQLIGQRKSWAANASERPRRATEETAPSPRSLLDPEASAKSSLKMSPRAEMKRSLKRIDHDRP